MIWTDPPEREEAGSPNLLGAVALRAAIDELGAIGWDQIAAHDEALADRLREGLSAIDRVRVLGAVPSDSLPVVTFNIERVPHALVAARLSAEHAIGVRHGCFCAHPYLLRLLDLGPDEIAGYRAAVVRGDRRHIPGAVRASAGLSTTEADVDRFLAAVRAIAVGRCAAGSVRPGRREWRLLAAHRRPRLGRRARVASVPAARPAETSRPCPSPDPSGHPEPDPGDRGHRP